jgi:4-alpha-glucanotransferase
MAAISTHDLPTVAGLWDGSDLKTQSDLGLEPNEASTNAIRDRLARNGGLPDDAHAEAAVVAAHGLLARAPCLLRSATLDDAIAVPERPNLPGADAARPNWALALPMALEQIQVSALAHQVAASLRASTNLSTEEIP